MKAVHIFFEVDLRCAHRGLRKIAERADIEVDLLDPGEAIIFFNFKKTAFKAYLAHNIIAHKKSTTSSMLTMNSLDSLVDAVMPGAKIETTRKFKQIVLKELSMAA